MLIPSSKGNTVFNHQTNSKEKYLGAKTLPNPKNVLFRRRKNLTYFFGVRKNICRDYKRSTQYTEPVTARHSRYGDRAIGAVLHRQLRSMDETCNRYRSTNTST